MPVIDSVARGGAVSRAAEKIDPSETAIIKEYLKLNREMWEELEIWFELRSPE